MTPDQPLSTPGEHDDQVAQAAAAELETLSTACRRDADRLDAFLADDFRELGASGAILTKDGTAARVAAHTAENAPDLVPEDLDGTQLADGLVLLTYRLDNGVRRTNRTSLWRRSEGGRWQVVHHQGTVVPPPEEPDRESTSRHIGVVVRRDPTDVHDFAADPAHLPLWAHGLAEAEVHVEDGALLVDSPMGRVAVRFVPPNDLGVLDHDVTLPDGTVVTNPVRVLSHPEGAEVLFTVRRLDLTEDAFERDCATVRADLERLRDLLEA